MTCRKGKCGVWGSVKSRRTWGDHSFGVSRHMLSARVRIQVRFRLIWFMDLSSGDSSSLSLRPNNLHSSLLRA